MTAPTRRGISGNSYRLPPAARPGTVRLQIADLARSLAYYEQLLGLRVLESDGRHALLAPQQDDRVLVELREWHRARPMAQRGRLGLYHYAILLPDRTSLGRFVRHLAAAGVQPGAGDHLVSEAFYLRDPDGLGIEVYADRPRQEWRRVNGEIVMATDPVDVDDLLAAAGDSAWTGMPAGTVMGHVHLHVGALADARKFYVEGMGFDVTTASYPGALFLAAGDYHHHLGVNTWAGSGATPAGDADARLLEWSMQLPARADIDAASASIEAAGYPIETVGGGDVIVRDPWGTAVRLTLGAVTRASS